MKGEKTFRCPQLNLHLFDQMTFTVSYLKQKGISQGVAQAEHKVFFRMLWNSLNNTVFHPDGMLGNTVVVNSRTAVSLIEE